MLTKDQPELAPARAITEFTAEPADQDRREDIDALSTEVLRLQRLCQRLAAQLLGKTGIDRSAYRLLAHLVVQGPARTSALAHALHTDPSTVSRQTAALVRAGLAERRADAADGRASVLAATAEGASAYWANRTRMHRTFERLLATWDPADLHTLTAALARINDDFERPAAPTTSEGEDEQ